MLEADVMASKAIPRIVRVPVISKRQYAPYYRVVDSDSYDELGSFLVLRSLLTGMPLSDTYTLT